MAVNIGLSRNGISVLYRCFNVLLRRGRKCKDKYTDKCLTCKFAKAEMSAYDATRILGKKTRYTYTSDRLPAADGEYLVYGRDTECLFPEDDYHWFITEYDSCAESFGVRYETSDSSGGKSGEGFYSYQVVAWAELPEIKLGVNE